MHRTLVSSPSVPELMIQINWTSPRLVKDRTRQILPWLTTPVKRRWKKTKLSLAGDSVQLYIQYKRPVFVLYFKLQLCADGIESSTNSNPLHPLRKRAITFQDPFDTSQDTSDHNPLQRAATIQEDPRSPREGSGYLERTKTAPRPSYLSFAPVLRRNSVRAVASAKLRAGVCRLDRGSERWIALRWISRS